MFGLNREEDVTREDTIFRTFIKKISDYTVLVDEKYNELVDKINEIIDYLDSSVDVEEYKEMLEKKKTEIDKITKDYNSILSYTSKVKEIKDKLIMAESFYNKSIEEINKIRIPDISLLLENKKKEMIMKLEQSMSSLDINKEISERINKEFNNILPILQKEVFTTVEEKVGKMFYEIGFNIQSFMDNKVEIKMNNPLLLVEMMIDSVNKPDSKEKRESLTEEVLKAWRNKIKIVLPTEIKSEMDKIVYAIDDYIDSLSKKGITKDNNLLVALRDAQHKLEKIEENKKLEETENKETTTEEISNDNDSAGIVAVPAENQDKIDFGI
jgi:hypothetical protein